ncbi:hypothetical protein CHLNCDRAFT_58790 [Chlorella variabilis]|uniref:Carboxypeptidase n=1 Tax=Chlorella variabilis TaxID=554065 RepID=E1ZNB4_CHLVA|nr:hypothetical protein CHLNCDRAFT_58790 [Chlorella variabilis]EFN52655.1 hypothetical protein CHLNCDRAFT_58790 [Chlorella variabilis]|eukprot:XP_005844757.1 hypothetical protein CHLNCDRAFT_58790 [Chlorella variabilis]
MGGKCPPADGKNANVRIRNGQLVGRWQQLGSCCTCRLRIQAFGNLKIKGVFVWQNSLRASGYVPIDDKGSQLFFLFYEAQSRAPDDPKRAASRRDHAPITLWLQGGPGCASLFGAFCELGPDLVDGELGLQPNPGKWNRKSALLFIDQPVGAGFSLPGKERSIPKDEMTLAADLYCGLQAFFQRYPDLQAHPLVIAGESYAGKYVPSIGHFILQQTAASSRTLRLLIPSLRPASSVCHLQVMAHADTAYFQGYIDPHQRVRAMTMQLEVVQLIAADEGGRWEEAHGLRSGLLEHIRSSAGAATLLDMGRYEDYDAGKLVDCYLNLPEVQEALGVAPGLRFESCSDEVGEALGPDVMKTVKHLVPDLLAAYPMLLYQGRCPGSCCCRHCCKRLSYGQLGSRSSAGCQLSARGSCPDMRWLGMRDAQDGAASSEAWIYAVDWEGRAAFSGAKRHILRANDMEEGEEEEDEGLAGEGAWNVGSAGATASSAEEAGVGDAQLLLGGGGAAAAASVRPQRQLQVTAAVASSLDRSIQRSGSRQQTAERQQTDDRQQRQDGGGPALGRRDASAQRVVAYWKQGGGLTHVVLTEAGHMVPRDAPLEVRWVLEQWLAAPCLPAFSSCLMACWSRFSVCWTRQKGLCCGAGRLAGGMQPPGNAGALPRL